VVVVLGGGEAAGEPGAAELTVILVLQTGSHITARVLNREIDGLLYRVSTSSPVQS
jgi:hypothetical protein